MTTEKNDKDHGMSITNNLLPAFFTQIGYFNKLNFIEIGIQTT